MKQPPCIETVMDQESYILKAVLTVEHRRDYLQFPGLEDEATMIRGAVQRLVFDGVSMEYAIVGL